MKTINNRYEVIEPICKTNSEIEYLVRDNQRGGKFKRMRIFDVEMSNNLFIKKMEEEFIGLKNHVHENLLNVYEFQSIHSINHSRVNRKQYFYTYEHWQENEIIHYLDLNKTDINAVISQLCKILRYLHFRGIPYKYLNFEHILIFKKRDQVKIKLRDLANNYVNDYYFKSDYSRFHHFLAPEIFWGESVDEKVDFYSFGVVFFYLYYQMDYQQKNIFEFLKESKSNKVFDFIQKTVSNIREERWESISELIEALNQLIWIEVDSDDYHYYDKIHQYYRIAGRDAIIKEIRSIIHGKYKKNVSYDAILIRGDSGTGKTRLLEEMVQTAKFSRYHYLYINVESPSQYVFETVSQIVQTIVNHHEVSPLLIQKYGAELASIVPEIAQKWNISEHAVIDSEKEYMRVLNRAYNFFVEFSEEQFVLLVVDNINFIHEHEKIFYKQLLNHKGYSNYLMLFTSRGGLFDEKIDPYKMKIFKLTSLTLEETGMIVRVALGCKKTPYQLTHRLMVESQGKVSRLKALLQNLWKEKHIFFDREKMTWDLSAVGDHFRFDYEEEKLDNYHHIKTNLSLIQQDYIERLSLLDESFNADLVAFQCEISVEEAATFLNEMEELKILNKRISDVEYVYAFSSSDLRKVFENNLADDFKAELRLKLIAYFERVFNQSSTVNEALIDLCLAAGEKEKAAIFSQQFAEVCKKTYNFSKSVVLFEKALSIWKELQHPERIIEVGICLLISLKQLGRFNEVLEVGKEISHFTMKQSHHWVDVHNQMAMVYYHKGNLKQSVQMAKKSKSEAKVLNYIEGQLEAMIVLSKCYVASHHFEEQLSVVQEGIALAESIKSALYLGQFHNELAVNYYHHQDFKYAEVHFKKSLNYYELYGNEIYLDKAYNNLGVVILDGFGDYKAAREYFKKASSLSQYTSNTVSSATNLSNLGETYMIESRYEMAIHYFQQSYEVSERTGDRYILIKSLLNQAQCYIYFEKYAKAHILISRIDHEISIAEKITPVELEEFYLLNIEYYIAMNHIMEAEKWRRNVPKSKEDLLLSFRFFLVDLYLLYMKCKNSAMQFEEVKAVYEQIKKVNLELVKPSEAKLLRHCILNIVIDLIENKNIVVAEEFLSIDSELADIYNVKNIRIKREFCEACLSVYATDRIEILLSDIKEVSRELLWKALKLKSDLHYEKGEYYQALQNQLSSYDAIYQLHMLVPKNYLNFYILFDPSKIELKGKISALMEAIIHENEESHFLEVAEYIYSLEDYFNLDFLEKLFNHPVFLKLIKSNQPGLFKEKMSSAMDLVKSMKKDEQHNIKAILEYLRSETFAEVATVYILDDLDQIQEAITVGGIENRGDISKLINGAGNDVDGFFISRLEHHSHIKLLTDDQKGCLFYPIYESNQSSHPYENRREDLLLMRRKIIGYVLLETTNMIHRFNVETLKIAKSFINLLYIFIDNYKLKKISAVDKLTGVYLRKFIESKFAIELNTSRTEGGALSVIMLDIDKFKNVNDTYGHRKGDEILTRLGEILNSVIRESDYVGRYGGEEFIVLLPQTTARRAYIVAEKIRNAVEDAELLGSDYPLTISLGISTYPKDGSNEDELIEKADRALYYSKNNGRNQSTSWDENLIKEGRRYDRLTGILTGNISSDTRTVQGLLDIMKQLSVAHENAVKDSFISLLDITEADFIQYNQYNDKKELLKCFHKKKGEQDMGEHSLVDQEKIMSWIQLNEDRYFIDWDEAEKENDEPSVPVWKSYIILHFQEKNDRGILFLGVKISEKEFDFSDFNFVQTLKPVLKQILLDRKS